MNPTISPVGDSAISIEFGQVIDPKINQRIRQTVAGIESLHLEGIIEMVPTYCALLIQYDALRYNYAELCRILEPICTQPIQSDESELVTVIEIPTVYGGEFGPDIGFVAYHNHLTEAEVVNIHSGTDYLVYMMGFIPGFTYSYFVDGTEKGQIMAGVGAYHGEKALALGYGYAPNDRVFLNASVGISKSEQMYGMGATWRIGVGESAPKRDNSTVKKLQAENDQLQDRVAKLEALVQQLIEAKA